MATTDPYPTDPHPTDSYPTDPCPTDPYPTDPYPTTPNPTNPHTKDPYEVLGIQPEASDEEIRAAYLRKVREHPPERNAEAFEQVRDAYAELRDPRERTRRRLFSGDPLSPLAHLLDGRTPPRRFVGPKAWLAALHEK